MRLSYSLDGEILGQLRDEYPVLIPSDFYFAAKEAAETVENEHDGWEMSWPLEIGIHAEDGSLLAKYSVEKEYSPDFYPNLIS